MTEPTTTDVAPGALAAVIWGILGIFLCGIVVGWIAINYARAAREAIAEDPSLDGAKLARAGHWLGIIVILGWTAGLAWKLAGA